jgi:mRNA interferase MazF
MTRGEVRWYRFRSPDKRRPVVVLTRDSAIEYLSDVIVAPITSTIRDIPTEVVLGPADGLPRACAVNLDHVQTVAKDRLGATIATLSTTRLAEVRDALLFTTGF